MPILKIFRGELADKLYSEKEIIKTKSKGLRVKKTAMRIYKRDMEELSMAEELVNVAKNQMFALIQFEDFMNFIHNDANYENIEAATLFSSINPEYDPDDIYTNLFANFDYVLNTTEHTDNSKYTDDNGVVKSLKEWYPYQYQKAYTEYYELYSEISEHQINIYKIANDAVGLIDTRRGEVDLVLSITKEISSNVSKLIDIAKKFGTNTNELNDIANDLNEQSQQVQSTYKDNLNENDETVFSVNFTTEYVGAKNKTITIANGESATIKITTNVSGIFTITNTVPYYDIQVETGGTQHIFTITNLNTTNYEHTIFTIMTKFAPLDSHYLSYENYNILSPTGISNNEYSSETNYAIYFASVAS